ncbi:TPA: hypothetical protein ACRCBW_001712 [Escherichia coli]
MVKFNNNFDFPLVTILTVLLFILAYFFKLGEAVYFGYPAILISLDLTSVANISLKLFFYFGSIVIGVFNFILNDGAIKLNKIKYVLWIFIAITIFSVFLSFKRGRKT